MIFIHQIHTGVYKLPGWARDSASSQQNNVECATAVDYDWPFNHTDIIYSATSSRFWENPHPKGTWDNRLDEVVMDCGYRHAATGGPGGSVRLCVRRERARSGHAGRRTYSSRLPA